MTLNTSVGLSMMRPKPRFLGGLVLDEPKFLEWFQDAVLELAFVEPRPGGRPGGLPETGDKTGTEGIPPGHVCDSLAAHRNFRVVGNQALFNQCVSIANQSEYLSDIQIYINVTLPL